MSVLSRSALNHVVGVEELLLGAMGASLAPARLWRKPTSRRKCGEASGEGWGLWLLFGRIVAVSVRVLVVEDEEALLTLLRNYLEREGFEVHETLDG